MKDGTTITARFSGYCNTCHFTFFAKEGIRYNGLAHHLDCQKALTDKYPRTLNPLYKRLIGNVSRSKMRQLLNQKENLNRLTSNAGARTSAKI